MKHAHSYSVGLCDDHECQQIHIDLHDERRVFAGFTVDIDGLDSFIVGLYETRKAIQDKIGAKPDVRN